MKHLLSLVFLGLFLVSAPLLAAVSKEQRETINTVISRYRKSELVQMDIQKKSLSKILKREHAEEGKLFFAGGLIRFETKKPDPALVVFDGKYLWNVQLPSEDFGGDTLVTRAKVDKKNRQQLIVTELLTKESLFKHFNLENASAEKDLLVLEATPKQGDWNMARLKLYFSAKENLVTRMEYWDDLDNHVDMTFTNQEFPPSKKKLFKYTAPKGVKVNDI